MTSAAPGERLRAEVAAREHLRQGRWEQALEAFVRAEQAARAGAEPAEAVHRLLLGQADACSRSGRLEQGRQALLRAFPDLQDVDATPAAADPLQAEARYLWGRLLLLGRQLEAGLRSLQQALAALPTDSPPGTRLAELRAAICGLLVGALSFVGRDEEALAHADLALQVYEHPAHADLAIDHAVALVNIAGVHWQVGQLSQAGVLMQRARDIAAALVESGRPPLERIWCTATANLGAIRLGLGDFDGSLGLYREAALGLERLGRRLRRQRDGALPGVRGSQAHTAMNLGFALFQAGRLDEAHQVFRGARRRYAALRRIGPGWQDDEARTWVNHAHVLARQGQVRAARRLYRQGWQSLQGLADNGRPHLLPQAANARLGLARTEAMCGNTGSAATHFLAAQALLVELASEGQLHLARAWLTAVADHADALLHTSREGPTQDHRMGQELLTALKHPPVIGLQPCEAACSEIDTGLNRLQRWTEGPQSPALPWLRQLSESYLGQLLDRCAFLIGESEPEALRLHAAVWQALVVRLGQAAQAMPQAPHLVADWFLRTRGLRAQRTALTEGRAPALTGLRTLLAELRQLEEEILAQGASGALGGTAAPGHPRQQARAQRWRELRERCNAKRAELADSGVLPGALYLQSSTLMASLPPGSALVMLARGAGPQVLGIALHGAPCKADAASARVGISWRAADLDGRAARVDVARSLRRLRQSMTPWTTGVRRGPDSNLVDARPGESPAADDCEPSDPSHDLQQVGEQLLHHTLVPLLDDLRALGVQDIALVPSADLHLLPYRELLGPWLQAGPCRLSVWPSCGACAQKLARAAPPGTRRKPRDIVWAVAATQQTPGPQALPWVVVEQMLTTRLWGHDRLRVLDPARPSAQGVSALLGMGHGWAPPGNPAKAGLLLGGERVLGAHDLTSIRHCDQVLLSCCVLGRVDEIHGEAMGFLSSSLGYRTHFGVGWLVEIPDAEACLFSLAFQHALHSAQAAAGPAQDLWSDTFDQLHAGLMSGQWPPGFGAWLEQNVPDCLQQAGLPPGPWLNRWDYLRDFDGSVFTVPPPSLRRLMPWVVSLGR